MHFLWQLGHRVTTLSIVTDMLEDKEPNVIGWNLNDQTSVIWLSHKNGAHRILALLANCANHESNNSYADSVCIS